LSVPPTPGRKGQATQAPRGLQARRCCPSASPYLHLHRCLQLKPCGMEGCSQVQADWPHWPKVKSHSGLKSPIFAWWQNNSVKKKKKSLDTDFHLLGWPHQW
jgi:hypothetical protein